MLYFFDFDRTVFDTDSFKKAFAKRSSVRELLHQLKALVDELFSPERSLSKRRIATRTFGTYASHGRLGFAPLELKDFLYPDAVAFMTEHAQECTIVTYGVRAFITAKVASALSHIPLRDIVYTPRKKGRTIKRLTEGQEGSFVFVDDAVFQLDSVSRVCPDVRLFEIRRDGGTGDGRWPVLRSFGELSLHE